tara:strand:+ start:202 stop:1299 length:1098 start_codon:yes stop_codon:yes gene_type:complete
MNSEKVNKQIENNDLSLINNKAGFYCISCKKYFPRMNGFKYHMKLIKQATLKHNSGSRKERTKGCTNIDSIPWITCQDNAQEQIDHFKMSNAKKRFLKKEKFMYMKLTKKDIILAKKQSSLAMADLFTAMNGKTFKDMNDEDRKVLRVYFDKQINLGYRRITMTKSTRYRGTDYIGTYDYTLDDKFYYLIKKNIIYAPFRDDKKQLIKVGRITNIKYGLEDINLCPILNTEEYKEVYGTLETDYDKEVASGKNYGKIDYKLMHRGNKVDGITLKLYKQTDPYEDREELLQYNINQCSVDIEGKTKTYGETAVYYSHTYKQLKQEFIENKSPNTIKIEEHSFHTVVHDPSNDIKWKPKTLKEKTKN